MGNLIIIVILLCIISSIIVYLYRAKKKGKTCIGCPYGGQCSSRQEGGCCSEHKKGDTELHSESDREGL
ncbi:MAG: FeoB-associated Cys-rich membrane protein [Lachnospiraceae bacterium]|nr:FeoB-associated Cys-rich membrane protein [Lachnospiraceae bacterium]